MPSHTSRNALVVRGGWDGHAPVQATDMFIPHLREHGFDVRVEDSPAVYADAGYMATVDLIMQCYTMMTIEPAALHGLRAAIAAGTGMAGWHGGIADSYRELVGLPAAHRRPVRVPSGQGPGAHHRAPDRRTTTCPTP